MSDRGHRRVSYSKRHRDQMKREMRPLVTIDILDPKRGRITVQGVVDSRIHKRADRLITAMFREEAAIKGDREDE